MPDARSDVLDASQRLLSAIDRGDWATYAELCDPSLTAFEPEAEGHLVSGLAFHRFYFDDATEDRAPLGAAPPRKQSSMSSPDVRIVGDCAIVCYTRLVQSEDAATGEPVVRAVNETRIWQQTASGWKHVHFHRSPCR